MNKFERTPPHLRSDNFMCRLLFSLFMPHAASCFLCVFLNLSVSVYPCFVCAGILLCLCVCVSGRLPPAGGRSTTSQPNSSARFGYCNWLLLLSVQSFVFIYCVIECNSCCCCLYCVRFIMYLNGVSDSVVCNVAGMPWAASRRCVAAAVRRRSVRS